MGSASDRLHQYVRHAWGISSAKMKRTSRQTTHLFINFGQRDLNFFLSTMAVHNLVVIYCAAGDQENNTLSAGGWIPRIKQDAKLNLFV